ncbi:beta-lactamase-like protein [Xylaria digitata]|nr:beta-lactamase-like protein [Xylaria digitata]
MTTPRDLHIPPSTSMVNVSIINTGADIKGLTTSIFVEPEIPGHEHLAVPSFSFLIQHPTQNRTLAFDLVFERFMGRGIFTAAPKDVREVLDIQGVDTKNIEGVVWSHSHFDHIGDVSTFEPSTKIIVGSGTKTAVFPGYPTNQAASFHESDVAGHEVEEMDFSNSPLMIGGLNAIDYFADGSFYLLDTPGHCIGHMCGLARVTCNPDSFILMSGDAVHHGGELRPHPWHPLPESILPNPFSIVSHTPCPGDLLQEADAHSNILITPAHDVAFLNVAEFFPKTANAFMEKGWGTKARWAWLADFAKAVGQDENIPRELFGDYRPVATDKA